MQKLRSNDKVEGFAELDRTQRKVGLLCPFVKLIIYSL
jgi:hypothetical protein